MLLLSSILKFLTKFYWKYKIIIKFFWFYFYTKLIKKAELKTIK